MIENTSAWKRVLLFSYNFVRFRMCVSKWSSLTFSPAPCHTPAQKGTEIIFSTLLLLAFFNSCWRSFCSSRINSGECAFELFVAHSFQKPFDTMKINEFLFPILSPSRIHRLWEKLARDKNTNDFYKIENGKVIFGVNFWCFGTRCTCCRDEQVC